MRSAPFGLDLVRGLQYVVVRPLSIPLVQLRTVSMRTFFRHRRHSSPLPAGRNGTRVPSRMPRRLMAAMQALSLEAEEKKKRKAAAAMGSTSTRKAKPSPASSSPTPSSSARAAVAARPQRAAREVIDEMTAPQPTPTELGVADFLSHLDSSHHVGIDDLHFGDGDSYEGMEETQVDVDYDETQDEGVKEEEGMEDEEEVVTEVEPPRGRGNVKVNPRGKRWSRQEERMSKEKKIEEQRLTLEAEKFAKEREDADRAIMFMIPTTLDEKVRAYWEIAREKILARESDGGGGAGGG